MKICVVGASGNVGRIIVEILLKKGLPNITLIASEQSIGKIITIDNKEFILQPFSLDYDIFLFATESDVSKQYANAIIGNNKIMLDSSDAYRVENDIPLIVPSINGDLLKHNRYNLISHANCIASPLSMALHPLLEFDIESVHIATYQSVSGAGKAAVDELIDNTNDVIYSKPLKQSNHFKHNIAFNVIPQIGSFNQNHITSEENKIINETQKILNTKFNIYVTSVRVPVLRGHSMNIWIDFKNDITYEDVISKFTNNKSIVLCHNYKDDYMCPINVIGTDNVFIGRIRILSNKKICFWSCSDNLRIGAATDITESLIILLQYL